MKHTGLILMYSSTCCMFVLQASRISLSLLTEQKALSADSQSSYWADIHFIGQLLSTQLSLSEGVRENKLPSSFLWTTKVENLNTVNQIQKCAALHH